LEETRESFYILHLLYLSIMIIRTALKTDFVKVAELYHFFLSTHNIFQKSNQEVVKYLKEQAQENDLLIYEENGALKGALFWSILDKMLMVLTNYGSLDILLLNQKTSHLDCWAK